MAMTEEQRKAQSERMKKMQAEKKAKKAAEEAAKKQEATTAPVAETKPEKTAEAKIDEEKESMKAELEAMRKQLADMQKSMANPVAPQTIIMQGDTQKVHFLYMADVADDNQFLVGDGGMYARITGRLGEFFVPKSELSRVMDSMFRFMLDKRWIICLDGLTEEEREVYGINYKPGELLDKAAFTRILELGDKVIDIYPSLCPTHQEIIGRRFYEGWLERNPAVNREIVSKLRDLTKEKNNAFRTIIDEMNFAESNT